MKAKEYLLQIRKYDNLIQNRLEEIYILKEKAKMIGNISNDTEKVRTSKNINVMQDTIVDYVQKEEELKVEISKYWEKRAEVIQCIEKLKNVEYDFLHKVYVQKKTLQEVADSYERTYSWATTIRARAIKSLQVILDAS